MKALILVIFTLLSFQAQSYVLKITGNKRTQDKFIQYIFKRCMERFEDTPKEKFLKTLSQCVMNERIFHEVKVKKSKVGYEIDVKERWTLFPIPILEADTAGNKYYGGGIVDSNLFGRRIILYAEYVAGTVNQFKIFYFDPSFLLTNHIFRFGLGLDDNQILQAFEGVAVNGFQEKETDVNFGLGYDWGRPSFTANLQWIGKQYAQVDDYYRPDDYSKLYLNLTFFYDTRDFKLSYDEGISVFLRARMQLERSDTTRAAHEFLFFTMYDRQALWNHIFRAWAHGGLVTNSDERDALKRGRRRGFRGTIQYSIWAENYYGLILGYDIPIKKWKVGTWVVGLFSDLTRIKNANNLGHTNFFAGGIGTYFYLKKLAIPGLGVEYGWQNQNNKTFWAMNVGFGF